MNRTILILFLLFTQQVMGQNALLIPDTLSGTSINLTLQTGSHQFYSGQNTATYGANGNILGPTLLLNQGDFVSFSVNNQLADTTTIHWHGLHVSSENDGGPHTIIAPNTTWSPSFTILDKAATYWYHPHLHSKTNEHVSKGIAGQIWVRDSAEASLNLPRTYGVDDFPLVLQTKDFDSNNEIVVHSNSDNVPMVNATLDPFLQVPAQVIRYRILNGSSQRTFNLGLSNGQSFSQIASDGGLLSLPFNTNRLRLAPGERAEILINFSGMNGQSIFLKSFASELPNGIYGATYPGMGQGMVMNGYNPNPLNGSDFDLLKFDVVAPNANPVTAIPTSLVQVIPLFASSANVTRSLTFRPVTMGPNQLNGKFLINNVSFDMNVINYTVPLNNTEIWELRNQSGISHPFHIHDVQFFILSRNGTTPPVNEQGRKDVVLVRPMETVRFIAKFEDFSNTAIPYMYHCHLLTHEDDGMMGQFVVENTTGISAALSSEALTIYPNPSDGLINVKYEGELSLDNIEIIDPLGRLVLDVKISLQGDVVQIESLPRGLFFLRITANGQQISKRILVR